MDSTALNALLRATPSVIMRHREKIVPSANFEFSDEPRTSQPGSKPPISISAMEYADMEAQALGELAQYCFCMGTVPRIPMRMFHFVHGIPRGTRSSVTYEQIRDFVEHLSIYCDEILETPGIDTFIKEMERMRALSLRISPNENSDDDTWLSIAEAVEVTGKSKATIMQMLSKDGIETSNYPGFDLIINKQSLMSYIALRDINNLSKNKKVRV